MALRLSAQRTEVNMPGCKSSSGAFNRPNIWDAELQKRQAKYPDLNFVRFVARTYGLPAPHQYFVLDIGSGGGANTKFLDENRFEVIALDNSPFAEAHIEKDIRDFKCQPEAFDCILDCNTLCHVEQPPLGHIKHWLKRGGKFFMVAPADDTWRGTLEGKGYCRVASEHELREMLRMFSDVKIYKASYPDFLGHNITSWVVEASR